MLSELAIRLADWGALDTWIVVTAALAAMSCALPGNFLVIRRQSMMGDALSHTSLPGVVIAFLVAFQFRAAGWISEATYDSSRHAILFFGAILLGVFSALLTEWVQRLGKVEASAALGVVFTILFAVGLLLVRVFVDQVHIDPDCVLYGTVETVVMDTIGDSSVPRAAVMGGLVLALNLLLTLFFFKELRVSAFDPALAKTLGINSRLMHYALMAVTAATLVSAFESVGSILVIAMLIAPVATAYLLTDRLSTMIGLSLGVAALSALLGHAMAISLPPVIFGRLGYPTVIDASTAGMIAVASGLLFLTAMLFGPRHGVLSKVAGRLLLTLKIAGEDVLGVLYRLEESHRDESRKAVHRLLTKTLSVGPLLSRLALWRLTWNRQIAAVHGGYQLTDSGRRTAQQLVRGHRLWEVYMATHFSLPDDHLHEMASRVEHFIDPEIRSELEGELSQPKLDPHGREIPPE